MLLDPAAARRGTEQVVIVHGSETRFVDGSVEASFPGGEAEVTRLQVESETRVRLAIRVSADAPEGDTTLALSTPGRVFSPTFSILSSAQSPSVRAVPASLCVPYDGTMRIQGTGTRFEPGVTTVVFEEGSGVSVTALEVLEESRLSLWVQIPGSSAGRTVWLSVTTGGRVQGTTVALLGCDAPTVEVSPPSARRGESPVLEISSRRLPFGSDVAVTFPWNPGIVPLADPEVLTSPSDADQRLRLPIRIEETAPVGPTTVWVTSGGTGASGAFTVLRDDEIPSVTFHPSSVRAGETAVPVQVTGHFTAFDAETRVESDREDVRVAVLAVASTANALLQVGIDETALPGPCGVTLVTSPDRRVSGVLWVDPPAAAAVQATPDVVERPEGSDGTSAIALAARGIDLTAPGVRLRPEPGSGMAVTLFEPTAPGTARVMLRLSRDAPFGPSSLLLESPAFPAPLAVGMTVVRAGAEAPSVAPGYLLLDGVSRPFELSDAAAAFGDAGGPWPTAALFHGGIGEVTAVGETTPTTLAFDAWAPPGTRPGRATLGIHGAPGSGDARHLSARLTALGTTGPTAVAAPDEVAAGTSRTMLVTADAGTFVARETVVVGAKHSGLQVTGSTVVSPDVVWVTVAVDHTALPGDRVLLLRTRGDVVPAVVTVTPATAFPGFAADTAATEPSVRTGIHLTGTGTAWGSLTRVIRPEPDPDLALDGLVVTAATQATLSVVPAEAIVTPGLRVMLLRTRAETAAGGIWVGEPSRDVRVAPGWLYAGIEGRVEVDGTAVDPAAATLSGLSGISAVEPIEVGPTSVVFRVTVLEDADGAAVLRLVPAAGADPTHLVLPVLPAPASVSPASLPLTRSSRPRPVEATLSGLDAAAGISLRAVGPDLFAGRPALDVGGRSTVDVSLGLDAAAPDRRWLVYLAETDAVALRIELAGTPSSVLVPGTVEPGVAVFPGSPAVRTLGVADGAWPSVAVSCDRPEWTTVSLVGGDGITTLFRNPGSDRLVPLVPADPGCGPVRLLVESERPVACDVTLVERFPPGRDEWEPNDEPSDEELIPHRAPDRPVVHRADLSPGYDVDRYVVTLSGPARIEAVTGLPAGQAMRPELVLEVEGPSGFLAAADPWAHPDRDRASVTTAEGGVHHLAVRAVAGTHGPYLLALHEPFLIEEVSLESPAAAFVEISAPPGRSLDGFRLVHRSPSGTTVAACPLDGVVAGADGRIVVAASPGLPGTDRSCPALASVSAPATLALVDGATRDVDLLGLGAAPGEGAPLDPVATPVRVGRCDGLDTDDNAADFRPQHAATPGAPNVCDFR